MAVADPQFRAERESNAVVLIGEIDAHTAHLVHDALVAVATDGDLRVDLSRVTFIDSSGLRVVLEAHQALNCDGRRLVLIAPSQPVARVIEVAGLVAHLTVEPPLDPAG